MHSSARDLNSLVILSEAKDLCILPAWLQRYPSDVVTPGRLERARAARASEESAFPCRTRKSQPRSPVL